MGSSNVLSEKDANNSLKNLAGTGADQPSKADIKSMEYHRQVLKSKMEEEKYGTTTTSSTTITISSTAVGASSGLGPLPAFSQKIIHRTLARLPANPSAPGACSSTQQYISPSDNIMSPCTAKLNALKGRHAGKAKPKSLFAQASAKKFVGENVLGARSAEQASSANASNTNQQGQ
ncbi:hypothetical protein EKO27_g1571 [Xylaria grammica]|uniref:Spo12-like protein n=1 Tax=Xylaria grammica TaxID=363999 RepID=A0A439DGK4_9PEZI|nr:hypothetical protein EKO27_g1571 [Xylaria grammica]